MTFFKLCLQFVFVLIQDRFSLRLYKTIQMPTIKRIVMTGDHFKMTLKQIADRILKMYRDGDKWIQ